MFYILVKKEYANIITPIPSIFFSDILSCNLKSRHFYGNHVSPYNKSKPEQFIQVEERFHKNIQTIYLYCFNRYQKYLYVKYSDFGPIHFNNL